MNIEFMGNYYDLKYEGTFMLHAIKDHEECQGLYNEIMRMEGDVENAMRSIGKEYLQLHSNLFTAKGKLDDLIIRLAYLKGAEDREKMLE